MILDAFSQVTGVPEKFGGYPAGTRAHAIAATRAWTRTSSSVFGRPERKLTSAAERMQDPTLTQALHAINGETLNTKLMSDHGLIARLVADGRSNDEVLTELYLGGAQSPADAPRARRHSGPAG